MEANESEERTEHETGFVEKENLEISSSTATNESHTQENVISE
jgi:hypothetical protein